MDERELRRYDEEEQHRVAEILYELEHVKHFTIRDFFKELFLSPPYTRLNIHPFWLGLPFYKTQIFDIYPFPSEQVLLRAHGVTVNQLLSLQDEGKIQIILAGAPLYYKDLKYLDPILRLNPPSYTYRLSAFIAKSHSYEAFSEWHAEGKRLFWGKLEKLRKAVKVSTDQNAFEGSVIGAWVNLNALGLNSLAEVIKFVALKDPFTAGMALDIFHELLCAPTTTCIRGCHSIPAEYVKAAAHFIRKSDLNLDDVKNNFKGGFPSEIGKVFIERYRLIRPKTFSEALEIYPDYKEARSALKALVNCVENKKAEGINYLTQAISNIFEDVFKIKSKKKTFEKVFQVTGVVGAASLSLTQSVEGFLGGIGFGLVGSVLSSSLAESVAKLNVPSSIVTLYDFEGKLTEKWK